MAEQSRLQRIARSVDQAREIILEPVGPLPAIDVALADALGQNLAAVLEAAQDSPPFATAAMDGFAVLSADISNSSVDFPAQLEIIGEQAAGAVSARAVETGTSIRIMTGAPCPPGADAVVPFELTCDDGAGKVSVMYPVPEGANIRPRGEEYRFGHRLISGGTLLAPAHLALLAANGQASVSVTRAPQVAVITGGDELRPVGNSLGPGQIWDSNSVMIASLCRQHGAVVAQAGLVSDRESEIEDALARAKRVAVDLIVTVGGISAGDYDHLKHVLVRYGEVELWDVAMKPGRPLTYGHVYGIPVVGLPGNPAAAFVSFHQFVLPMLCRMMGRSEKPRTVIATAQDSFQNRGGRRNFIRVIVESVDRGYLARSAGPQGSASILTLARANGLLVIPESVSAVEIGDQVRVQLLIPGP